MGSRRSSSPAGGIEFIRVFSERVYGVPPEQVIGTSIRTKLEVPGRKAGAGASREMDFFDDGEGKPVGIQMHIGRRPIAAFGNGDGDLQMLQWTAGGTGPRFCLFVHHTDAEREWAYDRKAASFGRLDKGLDEATAKGWTVVDMKKDWNTTFAAEQTNGVTAIDILLEPDATMFADAEANNARLLESLPEGIRPGRGHRPHITLFQRFVRTEDLDQVYAAADKVLAGANVTRMKLEAFKAYYVPGKDIGLAGIVVKPTPELLTLQQELIAAVAPFTMETGTISAFVSAHDDPALDAILIEYVSTFVPKQAGEHFSPHVSTGAAPGISSTKCSPNRLSRSPSRPWARLCTNSARSARRRRNSKNGI